MVALVGWMFGGVVWVGWVGVVGAGVLVTGGGWWFTVGWCLGGGGVSPKGCVKGGWVVLTWGVGAVHRRGHV